MNVVMIVVRAVACAAHRESRRDAGHRRVRERPAAGRLPAARGDQARACSAGHAGAPAAEGVRRIGKLMLPGILGSSMAQVSLLLDTHDRVVPDRRQRGVAVFRGPPHGVPARRVQHRAGDGDPAGALATSRRTTRRSTSPNTLDWALRLVILLVSPAAVAMLVFAGPMTATIFGYGKFRRARRARWRVMRSWRTRGDCWASAWSRCWRPDISRARTRARRCASALIALGCQHGC